MHLDSILAALPKDQARLRSIQETLFANAIMIAAPTFQEADRTESEERMEIDPIYTGVNQLTALLRFIDANEMPPVDTNFALDEEGVP